jgi:RNA polymerase-binding transcription factor DksA
MMAHLFRRNREEAMSRSSSAAAESGGRPAAKAAAAKTSAVAKTATPKAAPKAATKTSAAKSAPRPKPVPGGGVATVDPDFAAFLDEIKAQLLDERATYIHQAELLKAEADLLAADREPGDVQFDEESGEGDTLAVERERDLALSAQARGAVDEIDSALAKIDGGTYGICEQCGRSIPQERLRAIPFASLCVQCKSMGLGRR